ELLKDFNPCMYTGSESPKQKDEAKEAFINGDCRVLIISLRAGAGLDGLQHVCRTGVIGELDYSTGVVDQCIGRYARDGQAEASMAYFMLADSGSDPIIADILGIKRGQIEGVMDPDADLIERLENEGGNVRKLAEAYLERVMLNQELVREHEDSPA
ncbi:MAG: ATP-dependent helicase, partial [Proteobacteria bacterium]|nr:ATP-dependent helicase [Pseudomonadota bacterium]